MKRNVLIAMLLALVMLVSSAMAVAFLASVDGTWNLDGQSADDGVIINQRYFTIRSKNVKLDAPFSMDKTEIAYNVDKSRVYCTGHSNGSMMTFTMAATGASCFAAHRAYLHARAAADRLV